MTRGLITILLLVLSNTFMTLAWYGHLKFKDMKWFENLSLVGIVLISWGIALFEYFFQVPANRLGFRENGGPFSLVEQGDSGGYYTGSIYGLYPFAFKTETIRTNHIIGFGFLILAVYFIFKK